MKLYLKNLSFILQELQFALIHLFSKIFVLFPHFIESPILKIRIQMISGKCKFFQIDGLFPSTFDLFDQISEQFFFLEKLTLKHVFICQIGTFNYF